VDAEVQALLISARSAVEGTLDLRPPRTGRAGAALARSALELAVNQTIDQRAPGAIRGNMRSKLIVLKDLGDLDSGREVTWAWGELSRCCHQHAYELSPAPAEIQHLVEQVESVVNRL